MVIAASQEIWSRVVDQLFGRPGGPLGFRFVFMPIMSAIMAIRTGLRAARDGERVFLWSLLFADVSERRRLLRSAMKDLSIMFIVGIVLDAIYQLVVFRAFYVVQALAVAVVCAVVPYMVVRGPVTFFTHLCMQTDRRSNTDDHKTGNT